MAIFLSDDEIAELIREKKQLPDDYRAKIHLRPKRGHKEREIQVDGANGSEFRVILRQSEFNALDFSVILTYLPPNTNQHFRLRRYNGKSHEHTNNIEKQKFYSFHIHQATARYQEFGLREDSFASATDRYSDFLGAVNCLFEDCNFEFPEGTQIDLFGEV